jgi:flagellar biosynthesis protein FlhB
MSSDETGERTQPPTERRRREARARGEVARSADLVAALVLLSAMVTLWWLGPSLGTEITGMMREGLSATPRATLTEQAASAIFARLAIRVAGASLPMLLLVMTVAVAANLIQTGFLWVPSSILPRFDRVDPGRSVRRWMSGSVWVGLGAALIRLLVLFAVLIAFVRYRLTSAAPLAEGEPIGLLSLSTGLLGELGVMLSLTLVVLALIDYAYQFWRYEQSLKMTVEEVRREQREDAGNPQIKRRRKEVAASRGTSRANSPGTGTDARTVDDVRPV